MHNVQVLDDPSAATVALHPMRNRLLSELTQPASAASLAARLDIPRQKITYHLHELKKHDLVSEASTRKWGGLTERLYVASAATYVVGKDALGPVAANTASVEDRLSASYLVALAARAVSEVGRLMQRAPRTGQRLATLSLDTDLRFASAEDRSSFTHELTAFVGDLSRRYHSEGKPGGRWHRLVIAAYPGVPPSQNFPEVED